VERADRLRKTPRQARSRSTVDAILAAADRVLRSEGYGAASTNRVARVAGFSVGSLYQYFDDKQAVVGALLDQALRAEAARIAQALDELAKAGPAAACDRSVRMLLAERRGKAHLLRILDAFGPELCAEPPLRHALRVQGKALRDPLHRFAAAHFGDALRGALNEGLAVAARFVHVLGYALAVDAPEHLDDETIARRAVAVLSAAASGAAPLSPVARELQAAWLGGSGAAFADAAGRARRARETRSALVRASDIPPAAMEPTVFLVASLGEAVAELRDAPAPGLDPALVSAQSLRLLQACLDSAAGSER
jgi:AcrR family transcriptional regulator